MNIVFRNGENELEVELTPSCYLDEVGKEEREQVVQIIADSDLDVRHDVDNKYDSFALEVFSRDVSIGYIRKRFYDRDRSTEIECFFKMI